MQFWSLIILGVLLSWAWRMPPWSVRCPVMIPPSLPQAMPEDIIWKYLTGAILYELPFHCLAQAAVAVRIICASGHRGVGGDCCIAKP